MYKWISASRYDAKYVAAFGTGIQCRAFYAVSGSTSEECLGEIISIFHGLTPSTSGTYLYLPRDLA